MKNCENIIKQYFSGLNRNQIQKKKINRFLKEFPEADEFLQRELIRSPEFLNKRNLIISILFNLKLKRCRTCGKPIKFSLKYISDFCSHACSMRSPEIREERQKACVFSSDEFKEKRRMSCLEKYGEDHHMKCGEILKKTEKTCIEKYGKKFLMQVSELKEKSKQTCLEKYSVENPAEISMKENLEKWKPYVMPLFDFSCYHGKEHVYRWKCSLCGSEFSQKIYKTNHIKEFPYLPRCWKCFPSKSGFSEKEKEVFEFCRGYFKDIRENSREIISPYELDIYIPEIKLAIEFDGLKWHCTENIPLNYHLMKTEMCETKGIRLLHILEDEWNSDKDRIKDFLKMLFSGIKQHFSGQKLVLDRRIYARTEISGYILKEVTAPEIEVHGKYSIENCGYLIYEKIRENN